MLSACALALSILSLCCYVSAASSASALLLLLHRPTTIRTAPRLSPPPTFLPLCRRATPKEHPIHRPVILSSTSSSKKNDVYIAFPGGGLFFYWQAGVIVSWSVNKKWCIVQHVKLSSHRLLTAEFVPLLSAWKNNIPVPPARSRVQSIRTISLWCIRGCPVGNPCQIECVSTSSNRIGIVALRRCQRMGTTLGTAGCMG